MSLESTFLKTLAWLHSFESDSPYKLSSSTKEEYVNSVLLGTSLTKDETRDVHSQRLDRSIKQHLREGPQEPTWDNPDEPDESFYCNLAPLIPMLTIEARKVSVGNSGENAAPLGESSTLLSILVRSCVIEVAQRYGAFTFLNQYGPGTGTLALLQTMQKERTALDLMHSFDSQWKALKDLWETVLIDDEASIRQYYEYLKLITVLLCVGCSPFYSRSVQRLANETVLTLTNVLADCRFSRIISEANTHGEMESGPKATTKLGAFFFLPNGDRYCLRFDSPHDDVSAPHFNLHEPMSPDTSRTTAFPLTNQEYESLLQHYNQNILDKLLYCNGTSWWFRNNFENLVKETKERTGADMAEVLNSFAEHKHHPLSSFEVNEDDWKTFIEALSEGLTIIGAQTLEKDRTKNINIDEELHQMFYSQNLREMAQTICYAAENCWLNRKGFEESAALISRSLSRYASEHPLEKEARDKMEYLMVALSSNAHCVN